MSQHPLRKSTKSQGLSLSAARLNGRRNRMVTIANSINVNYQHRRANAGMEPEEGTAFLSPFLLLHSPFLISYAV